MKVIGCRKLSMLSFFRKKPFFIIRLSEDTGVPPIPVYEKKIIIGRGTNHILALPDTSISRNHIEVNFKDGNLSVIDLGTSNGTKINGEFIPANVVIPYVEGQVVQLGQSQVQIRFELYRIA